MSDKSKVVSEPLGEPIPVSSETFNGFTGSAFSKKSYKHLGMTICPETLIKHLRIEVEHSLDPQYQIELNASQVTALLAYIDGLKVGVRDSRFKDLNSLCEFHSWCCSQSASPGDNYHNAAKIVDRYTENQGKTTEEMHTEAQFCKVAPQGWKCTRRAGHTGPCAASDTRLMSTEDLTALAIHTTRSR